MFTLDMVDTNTNLILLSTGTGLAPYMSMIRTVLEPKMDRQIVIAHGARHSWDLGYRSELMTLRSIFKNLHYIPIISRPKDELIEWGGKRGYIQDIWDQKDELFPFTATPQNSHIFLCGNPAMIDDMLIVLTKQGYKEHSTKSPGNIHFERYW
jgi:ferredoxin--NADP+ reductase